VSCWSVAVSWFAPPAAPSVPYPVSYKPLYVHFHWDFVASTDAVVVVTAAAVVVVVVVAVLLSHCVDNATEL